MAVDQDETASPSPVEPDTSSLDGVVTHIQLDDDALTAHAVQRNEGQQTADGGLAVATGKFTGRSPDDKYIVDEPESRDAIWWGEINQSMAEATFTRLARDVRASLATATTFRQHLLIGADRPLSVPVHLITSQAWIAQFARQLFIVPEAVPTGPNDRTITILHAPTFQAIPDRHGTRGTTVIAIHPSERIIIIAGTAYAGEVKKSVFTLMQYLLPRHDVLTMHCSANVSPEGSPTLFFGLSGTGKTTLSNDPARALIGDDEHAWTDRGIVNLEGGCYAKTIRLSRDDEPGIYQATRSAGTVLENVVLDPVTLEPDFDDVSLTENTRSAFSIDRLPNAATSGTCGHPDQIVLLTADATGVLPAVAKLSPDAAITLFLLGFTSRIAGTERGVGAPEVTFSPCFAAPFLMFPPDRYAELFAERIRTHRPGLWLVNTGWTGGTFATGERISIAHTRAIVSAITSGVLTDADSRPDPIFRWDVPTSVTDVPHSALRPRDAWPDVDAYDRAALELRATFRAQAAAEGISASRVAWLSD